MLDYLIKQIIKLKPTTSKEVFNLKRRALLEFGKKDFPKNSEILNYYRQNYRKRTQALDLYFEKLLRRAPIRSLSGIVSVTVLTKPFKCPGNCLFCPKESGMPKSYLKNEPAAARAYALKFDPYLQVKRRIETLEVQGHKADKIELIVLGGTWSYYPKQYQNWVIRRCFEGANCVSEKRKAQDINSKLKAQNAKPQLKTQSLAFVQKINETAEHRIIGLTLETRPDYINEKEIKRMRELGVTRIELGAQSLDDYILKLNNRGHDVAKTIHATKLLKDAGFKINYHIMLDLPGSNMKIDEQMFETLFTDTRFQPDWLKIYPTSVLKTAPLYKLWKAGKYKPYTKKRLEDLLINIKQKIPPYVRITRLIRDIPLPDIVAGSEISNLRQDLHARMKKEGTICQCIRCREVREMNYDEPIELVRRDYNASSGKEIFLSFEDKKRQHLYALLRLRISSQYFSGEKHFIKELQDCALIREVHTYGDVVPLTKHAKLAYQHKGLGKKLITETERIAKKEYGIKKIAVISGIGVREYYRKMGYKLEGTYMTKTLNSKL